LDWWQAACPLGRSSFACGQLGRRGLANAPANSLRRRTAAEQHAGIILSMPTRWTGMLRLAVR
jgi:hypothetical protein